ncbi:UDP-N-acetylglucosamine transporter TMEM241 homolog [Spinachia spinachia]
MEITQGDYGRSAGQVGLLSSLSPSGRSMACIDLRRHRAQVFSISHQDNAPTRLTYRVTVRSAALSWLPGSLLYVGNIYAGSRALSLVDIPFFFTLQNSSHVVSYVLLKVVKREVSKEMHKSNTKCSLSHDFMLKCVSSCSICFMLLSAINLPIHDPQFDHSGYLWAVGHLLCVGAYRVFQGHYTSSNLSVLLLTIAAHPTGDLTGALEFPSLQAYSFHCGCCAR